MPGSNLVTGATGFIGAELTRQLLARGEIVRGTTRDAVGGMSEYLRELPGAEERLELVEQDLLAEGWEEVVRGCDRVFHVASPYRVTVDDPERDLVRPAVEGTRAVLRAVDAVGDVTRVVLTSSVAAVMDSPRPTPVDESSWNTESRVDRNPYAFSKTQAEQAAWRFMEEADRGFDLVAINPSGVIGPTVVPRLNQSHGWFAGMTDGSQPGIVALEVPMVDVREVAEAHIAAMERPEASGRYLVSAWSVRHRDVYEIAGELDLRTRYAFPKLLLDKGFGITLSRAFIPFQPKGLSDYLRSNLGVPTLVDASRVERELGIVHRTMEESITDTWRNLDEWGLLGRQS